MSAFEKLYDRIFAALSGYPGLVGTGNLVPTENVHPSDDPLDLVPGMSIVYSLSTSSEDLKARRFDGVITLTTGSPKSKMDAHLIMSSVRRALVPRALTGGGIVVGIFREQTQATDAGRTGDVWRVTTLFQFKMVEGSL